MVENIITLTVKRKWFNMILSGEKKEEYRELKTYYDVRLPKEFGMFKEGNKLVKGNVYPLQDLSKRIIRFRNGYSKNSPCFTAICSLSIGTGREEWGAEKGKDYYILKIHQISSLQEEAM